jgi:hypothetical protein
MTSPFSFLPADRHLAIADALYRFAAGQDLKDRDLFLSAFAEDAVLDFVQPAARLGRVLVPFEGRAAIAAAVLGSTGDLDTTHTVTNLRIEASDEAGARLHALVEAQHLPRGDHGRHLLLKNHYHVDLRPGSDVWRIARMVIRNAWMTGDPTVLFPG